MNTKTEPRDQTCGRIRGLASTADRLMHAEVPTADGLCRLKRVGLATVVAISLASVSGCSWWNSMIGKDDSASAPDGFATTRPATTQVSTQDIAPVPPAIQISDRPVVKGPLPLVYLVEADGTLRVRNVDTNEEIITFPVKASQIVRVESKGVLVANKSVIGATLVPGTYAIEFVYPDSNAVRSNQTRTGVIPNQ